MSRETTYQKECKKRKKEAVRRLVCELMKPSVYVTGVRWERGGAWLPEEGGGEKFYPDPYCTFHLSITTYDAKAADEQHFGRVLEGLMAVRGDAWQSPCRVKMPLRSSNPDAEE